MRASAAAAALQAVCDYDSSLGVPLAAFVRQRVVSRTLTEYRREWRYCLRFTSEPNENEHRIVKRLFVYPPDLLISLRHALSRLRESDRWIIEQLFWEGSTEAAVAQKSGVSQQAISRRKRLILHDLRQELRPREKIGRNNGRAVVKRRARCIYLSAKNESSCVDSRYSRRGRVFR
jgi:DNA-directed RNA polymerase specialized sigma subunit